MAKANRDNIKKQFDEEYGKKAVTVIPAKPEYEINVHDRHELVGPYCRVSTMSDEQVESYELQRKQYEKVVSEHPNWTLVDIYADEGISATSIKRRKDFLRLIEDCKLHKVSLILTKSVTRFARNTVDCIKTCRELKALDPPVGVFFETENIFTLDGNSEMMLNIYAALAQSESETKSVSIKWGIRNRFRNGIPRISDLYGYVRDKRELTIDEDEATVVRLMYDWFLSGFTISEISQLLYQRHIPSPQGKERWTHSTICYILTNERYAGHVLMQKTYVDDLFSHRSVPHRGQLPQYRLENYCPAIIAQSDWAEVQIRLLKNSWDDFLSVTHSIETDDGDKLYGVYINPSKN